MPRNFRVSVAQLNQTVGDLYGNANRIILAAQRAHAAGSALLLTPELGLTGYSPQDALQRKDFQTACESALRHVVEQLKDVDICLVIGHPYWQGEQCFNAASVIYKGGILGRYHKHYLPNYGVFDEARQFSAGGKSSEGSERPTYSMVGVSRSVADGAIADPFVFEFRQVKFGLLICEDLWHPLPARWAKAAGAQALLVLNASPFQVQKQAERIKNATQFGMPLLSANLVGGQDNLVFDGASFALNANGNLVGQADAFVPELLSVDCSHAQGVDFATASPPLPLLETEEGFSVQLPYRGSHPIEAEIYAALVVGVRDYLGKNHFTRAYIGLSGGIDSALTLRIAVDALGPLSVNAVMMPSPWTSDTSLRHARKLAHHLDVRYTEIPITSSYDMCIRAITGENQPNSPGPEHVAPLSTILQGAIGKSPLPIPTEANRSLMHQNLQARIRGNFLMALANLHEAIVLSTGNKSETAVGYCTLYGDMAGGLAVLQDIYKTMVYRLARWRNKTDGGIPEAILTRPPTAELKPNQLDQDTLPDYAVLDDILEQYIEKKRSALDIATRGHPPNVIDHVLRLVHANEHKRYQAPPGIKVTARALDKEWHYPIAGAENFRLKKHS